MISRREATHELKCCWDGLRLGSEYPYFPPTTEPLHGHKEQIGQEGKSSARGARRAGRGSGSKTERERRVTPCERERGRQRGYREERERADDGKRTAIALFLSHHHPSFSHTWYIGPLRVCELRPAFRSALISRFQLIPCCCELKLG